MMMFPEKAESLATFVSARLSVWDCSAACMTSDINTNPMPPAMIRFLVRTFKEGDIIINPSFSDFDTLHLALVSDQQLAIGEG